MSQNDYSVRDRFLFLQEPSPEENRKGPLTVAQKKARNIMESFENPFRMVSNSVLGLTEYLPGREAEGLQRADRAAGVPGLQVGSEVF